MKTKHQITLAHLRKKSKGLLKTAPLFSLTALSLGIGTAINANAQDTLMLEEVMVTATRRETGLQDTAASIAAVTGNDLKNQGITDFSGVSDAISGLTLDFPSNAINAAIYMRGVGTTGAATVQSVSTMIDGVYQIRQGVAFTELMDIQRVEVLRGPQGTLFGKNSTSGAIRIFTADPDTNEFSGNIQAVVGNLNAREKRIILNIPLIEGKLAARFSGYDVDRDGYTKNFFLDEETRNVDREGWRAKLLWNATDDLQVKFTAEKHDQTSNQDNAIVKYSPLALETAVARGASPLPEVSLGRYADSASGETAENVERYILNITWDVANHTLSTLHSREDNITFLNLDRDETASPGVSTVNTGPLDIETHEIQWSSNFDGPFSYLIGYYKQDEDSLSITSIPGIFSGTTAIAIGSDGQFANATYDFTDQWSLSLGIRKDEDERTGSNRNVDLPVTFEETTYSAKITYQHDDDRMFYFSHDKGFKSGGVNREFSRCGLVPGAACLDPDNYVWDPEIAYNYEVGIKSEWYDNRLRLNGAIFFTTFEDFQVSENVPAGATVIVTNAAEVETKGVELDFSALISDSVTLSGSMTYVQSEYTDFEGAPCAEYATSTTSTCTQDLSGKTLDHAPELSFNLGADYRAPLAAFDGVELFGRLDVVYKDDQNLYVFLSEDTEEDAYAVWNARFGLESVGNWKLTLWGKNITDEDYRTSADLFGDGGLSAVPGIQATYGLTADWYF